MNPEASIGPRKFWRLIIIAFLLITGVGVGLRIYPSAGFTRVGYDESLYRRYVDDLSTHGLTSYPDFAEYYVERQQQLPGAILPPTRFLYIYSAYVWRSATGEDSLTSLHHTSCLFSILLLIASMGFAWRLGGVGMALGVGALMACAPTQIHMGQHALIDGFFAFWATLTVWFFWESLRSPGMLRWAAAYALAFALMVMTKENAAFAALGILALLSANHWLKFGKVTPSLLLLTIAGPLLGFVLLVALCGGLGTFIRTYQLLTAKASILPYAIATGDGPWYRYLVDLLLVSPLVFLLAWGWLFRVTRDRKPECYLLVFIAATYLAMCNVKYGMNLRYTNMWDMPLRYLALGCVVDLARTLPIYRLTAIVAAVAALCAFDLRQYYIFFVQGSLYELVTSGLLHALKILK